MGWFLLIGLFCVLAVIGFFITGRPFKFALGGIIFLIAVVFVILAVIVIWEITSPCTAPFSDHGSSYCQNQAVSTATPTNTQTIPINQTTTEIPPSLPDNTNVINQTQSSQTDGLPQNVGDCSVTSITQVGTRLMDGTTNKPIPGTGSAIWYANGGYQVSYDTIQGISDSQVNDQVNLCLVSVPTDCPAGDNRGRFYQATNLRTQENWTASDSEHSCGGA